jgi:probable phosphoglycerate mutase
VKHVNLVLCRHTEIDLNFEKRYSGQLDPPLNGIGVTQAKQLAHSLLEVPLKGIYCSDLHRTYQVMVAILSARRNMQRVVRFDSREFGPIVLDSRLRELDVGEMAGMTKADALAKFPGDRYDTKGKSFDFTSIGGETRLALEQRQLDCFQEIARAHGSDSAEDAPHIGVVGHGTALRVFLETREDARKLEQGSYLIVPFSA